MSRIPTPARDAVPAASALLLGAVERQLGIVSNMFRLIGLSPNALGGFLAQRGALARTLDVKTRERIALAVAQVNGCDYCLSRTPTSRSISRNSTRPKSPRAATVIPVTRRRTKLSASPPRSRATVAR